MPQTISLRTAWTMVTNKAARSSRNDDGRKLNSIRKVCLQEGQYIGEGVEKGLHIILTERRLRARRAWSRRGLDLRPVIVMPINRDTCRWPIKQGHGPHAHGLCLHMVAGKPSLKCMLGHVINACMKAFKETYEREGNGERSAKSIPAMSDSSQPTVTPPIFPSRPYPTRERVGGGTWA